jgi:hypothetical protein
VAHYSRWGEYSGNVLQMSMSGMGVFSHCGAQSEGTCYPSGRIDIEYIHVPDICSFKCDLYSFARATSPQ